MRLTILFGFLAITMATATWCPVSAQAVRVMVVDETENRPIADRAEIWARGKYPTTP